MTASSEAKGRHITMVNPQAKHLSTMMATAPMTTPSEAKGKQKQHRHHDAVTTTQITPGTDTTTATTAPKHHGQPKATNSVDKDSNKFEQF
jgi:hypothetical protein